MIVVAATVHSLFPAIAVRHWFFWVSEPHPDSADFKHHIFDSAVTMGTLIIRNPQNALASYALTLIDSTILLLTRAIVSWPSPRLAKNLKWLHRLRGRAAAKLSTVALAPTVNDSVSGRDIGAGSSTGSTSDDEDVELVGWCTRLVERGATGAQTVRTILSKSAPSPNILSSPDNDLTALLDVVMKNTGAGNGTVATLPGQSPSQNDPSTDTLVSIAHSQRTY